MALDDRAFKSTPVSYGRARLLDDHPKAAAFRASHPGRVRHLRRLSCGRRSARRRQLGKLRSQHAARGFLKRSSSTSIRRCRSSIRFFESFVRHRAESYDRGRPIFGACSRPNDPKKRLMAVINYSTICPTTGSSRPPAESPSAKSNEAYKIVNYLLCGLTH